MIVKEFDYFTLELVGKSKGRDNYVIINKPNLIVLGYINWHPMWRKWVLTTVTEHYVLFDKKCLIDIVKCLDLVEEKDV